MALAAGGLATMIHRSSYKLNQAETFGFWIARRQFSKVLYFFRCSSEKNQPSKMICRLPELYASVCVTRVPRCQIARRSWFDRCESMTDGHAVTALIHFFYSRGRGRK